MKEGYSELASAIHLVSTDPTAREVFNVLTKNPGISGFETARVLNQDPNAIKKVLESLRQKQLVRPGEDALRENLALTGSGFLIRQYL